MSKTIVIKGGSGRFSKAIKKVDTNHKIKKSFLKRINKNLILMNSTMNVSKLKKISKNKFFN